MKKKISLFLTVLMIAAAFAGFLTWQTHKLNQKAAAYAAREAELALQIEGESRRSEELEEYNIFTHTLKYMEQVAREKLGLVYPDEVIVEPER